METRAPELHGHQQRFFAIAKFPLNSCNHRQDLLAAESWYVKQP
jgi:hypothetical protein